MEWCRKNKFRIAFEGEFKKKKKRGDRGGATRYFKLAVQESGNMRLIFSWLSQEQSRTRPDRPRALYDITTATLYSGASGASLEITIHDLISFPGLSSFLSSRKVSGIVKGFVIEPRNVQVSKEFREALKGAHKHIMPLPPEGAKKLLKVLRRTNLENQRRLTMTRDAREKLQDGYQTLGKLGEGGFATVFKAIQKSTGNEVAVKIFSNQRPNGSTGASSNESENTSGSENSEEAYLKSPQFKARCFEWEINVMQLLQRELPDHKHLVKLIQVCTSVQEPRGTCLVMELMNGGELFDRLVKETYFTDSHAAKLFRTMAGAVHDMHEVGVLHRDLKPENIIFMGNTLKIADFGTAMIMHEADRDPYKGIRIGSPGYSAPEVSRHFYSTACDVFSLGVILHLMLVGFSPFDGVEDNPGLLYVRMIQNSYDWQRKEWANIDPDAIDLLKRMLVFSTRVRITLPEILSHKWLKPGRRQSQAHLGMTLLRMEAFNEARKEQAEQHTVDTIFQERQRLKDEIKSGVQRSFGASLMLQSSRKFIRRFG